jgi:hypothetical protein
MYIKVEFHLAPDAPYDDVLELQRRIKQELFQASPWIPGAFLVDVQEIRVGRNDGGTEKWNRT